MTSRRRKDPVVAGHQETTREWWQTAGDRFELVASELVIRECSAGDKIAVDERLAALSGVSLLRTTNDAETLARALLAGHAVPKSNPEDALHIAIAVVHGIEFLVTWNFRHIANAAVRGKIEQICRDLGFEPPVICSPEELMGT